MEVRVVHGPLSKIEADVLVLGIHQAGKADDELDHPLRGAINQALKAGDFRGEYGATMVMYTGGAIPARKILLFGLGMEWKLDIRKLRKAAGMAVRAARDSLGSGGSTVALAFPPNSGLTAGASAQFIVEGALHGLHRFKTFKTSDEVQANVASLLVVGGGEIQPQVLYGRILAEATNLARDVNWLPGNHMTAAKLGEKAQEVCREAGVEIAVYDKKGCQELGLGLLLAVNQGSEEEPRFIVMRHKGNGGNGPWLGLVGKGVTFDTGGISIKPTENMWDMKYDMSGAGAVLGAMQAIGKLKPKCDVIAVIAATDNMPDGNAYKPGDVISGLSGKTVEVRSTDAEGRLVLSDGLAYAVKQGASRLMTASTLTGAANVALGPIRFGVVANDDAWEDEVMTAATEAGERGWKLPHDEEYYDLFKSPIADMSNTGTARAAGTVVGGLFLMMHVGDTPCVHMDIASLAWRNAADKYEDVGATGVAVKTFVRAAVRFAEANQ